MFSVTTEIIIGQDHPGRDALFERVDEFRFVDDRPGSMIVRSLTAGAITIGTVRSIGHDIALHVADQATFLAPMRGMLCVDADGADLRATDGSGAFLRPGYRRTSVRADSQGGFCAAVALGPGRRRAAILPPGQVCHPDLHPAGRAMRGYLLYFVSERAKLESPLQRPAAMRATEALFLDLFAALDEADNVSSQLPTAIPERHVRAAEEIMRAQSDEPLTVALIAEMVGVGVRSLQAGFRAHRGVSPRHMLNRMRLERARERLLVADPVASVSSIALLSGFVHVGRFSTAYHARFGEFPSETMRRSRR